MIGRRAELLQLSLGHADFLAERRQMVGHDEGKVFTEESPEGTVWGADGALHLPLSLHEFQSSDTLLPVLQFPLETRF